MKTLNLTIPDTKLGVFEKEFKKLTAYAQKMGVDIPVYKKLGTGFQTIKNVFVDADESASEAVSIDEYKIEVTYFEINISESFKFSGWNLISKNDHEYNVVDLIDLKHNIPEHLGLKYLKCDHCGTTYKNRVTTFVLQDENTGKYIQVGSSCIHQFLGISPTILINLQAKLYNVINISVDEDDDFLKDGSDKNKSYLYNRRVINMDTMFSAAYEIVSSDEFKYVRKVYSDTYPFEQINVGKSTNERIIGLLEGSFDKPVDNSYKNKVFEFLSELAVPEAYILMFPGLDKYDPSKADEDGQPYREYLGYEDIESFQYKLKSMLDCPDRIRIKDSWQVALAINGYERHLKNLREIEQNKHLKHVGVIGEKSELKLTIVDFKTGESFYGDWTLWIMVDEFGNRFNKFGRINSKFIVDKHDGGNTNQVQVGDTIHVLAEIKAHDTKFNAPQTLLGRLSKVKPVKVKKDKKEKLAVAS